MKTLLLLPALVVGIVCASHLHGATTNTNYRYSFVARSGGEFTGFETATSINDAGMVAFIGLNSSSGAPVDELYRGDGTSDPTLLNYFLSSATRDYGPFVEINNDGDVVARDRASGSPPTFFVRKYSGDFLITWTVIARSGTGIADYNSVTIPSLNNPGQVSFVALEQGSTLTSLKLQTDGEDVNIASYGGSFSPRPALDDAGNLVFRDPQNRLVLWDPTGTTVEVLASTAAGFTSVGQSPGIGSDGRIVGFYGVDTGGAGIFVNYATGGNRSSYKVVSLADGFSGFSDARVGVTSQVGDPGSATLVFLATRDDKLGIYSARVRLPAPDSTTPEIEPPVPVAQQGDFVFADANRDGAHQAEEASFSGTISNLAIYDPINQPGQVAFWMTTDSAEVGIIQATPIVRLPIVSLNPANELPTVPTLEPSILRSVSEAGNTRRRRALLLRISTPLPNQPVRAWVEPEAASGHHPHGLTARRRGWLRTNEWQAYPKYNTEPGYQVGGSLIHTNYDTAFVLQSDSGGIAKLYYLAPEISGREIVIASTDDEDPAKRIIGTITNEIRVPGLVALQATPDMQLVGTTDEHPSPSNHHGSNELAVALAALARNYAAEAALPDDGLQFSRLRVNDMSLPLGGLFDVDKNKEWTSPHIGHRLGFEVDIDDDPPNATFSRLLQDVGFFTPIVHLPPGPPPPHHHLILNRPGRVTVAAPGVARVESWNGTARTLAFTVTNENRGGFALTQTTVTSIQLANGVTLDSPATPVALGPLAIRTQGIVNVGATLPLGVNSFLVTWNVTGTAANGNSASFNFSKIVAVPPGAAQFAKLKPVPGLPHVAISGWELLIPEPNLEAAVGSPKVISAQVRNQTGSPLLLSDLYVRLATDAKQSDYSLTWAPDFIATGGLIPAQGYSGPLVQLTWHVAPPVSSISTGFIELHTAAPVDNPVIAGSFVVTYQLQSLQVALDGAEVLITWPASATGLRLQQSNDLMDPQSWFWPDHTPKPLGDVISLRMPFSEAVGFFRLGPE